MYVVNMHLPERWGYVQWSDETVNSSLLYKDPTFSIRTALAQIYNAQRKFNTITGKRLIGLAQQLFVEQLRSPIIDVSLCPRLLGSPPVSTRAAVVCSGWKVHNQAYIMRVEVPSITKQILNVDPLFYPSRILYFRRRSWRSDKDKDLYMKAQRLGTTG